MKNDSMMMNCSVQTFQRKRCFFAINKSLIPLYLFILPGIVLVVLFNYIPMLGLQLAFKDWEFSGGIWGSPWAGLRNFAEIMDSVDFWKAVLNTFLLTFSRLIIAFPAPIILAVLINEITANKYKRVVQTISYLPHFISWVIVVGLLDALLSIEGGAVNSLLQYLGIQPVMFMASESWFRVIFLASSVWKEVGWGTILYLAAIYSINPELYEASKMDGAGKFAQITHITLPCIIPIISIMLVLSIPSLLSVGIDQIYPMINPANIGASEVIDTYVLRLGIGQAQYSLSTAIGIITSVLSTTLLILTNTITKHFGGEGIW